MLDVRESGCIMRVIEKKESVGIKNKTAVKKKKGLKARKTVLKKKHFSEVVLITCGDYRVAFFVRKYLKRIHKLWEMDISAPAGGSRAITLYGLDESSLEYECFKIKQQALWIDVKTYLTHDADICVLADHSSCAMWPKFESEEEEDKAHIQNLIESRKIILEKFPTVKKVILFYIVIHPLKHTPIKMKEIDEDGNVKTIVIKRVRKLSKNAYQ